MSRPKPQRIDTKPPEDQTYTFYPLETANPIRLLYLSKQPDGTLQYTLKHADLDADPRPIYNCLSYTWGYPKWDKLSIDQKIDFVIAGARSEFVTCDSQILKITPNLASALKRLWNEMSIRDVKTGEAVPIWIDSICIHQENNDERSAQVAKMDEIYRHASKVIVWLGPEDEMYTETAVEILNRLSLISEENRVANIPPGLEHPDIYHKLGIPRIETEEWIALGELMMRTWFSRMWVIQETFEADQVVVYCGHYELEWEKIVQVSETLTKTNLGSELMAFLDCCTSDINEESEEVVYVDNKINNQWMFQDVRKQKKELKLETLLKYARYFGATGHHDYVYAVRGMWKPEGQEMERLRETIKPDYNLPVEDVFTAATYACIIEIGDLNMLCYVEDSSLRKIRKRKEDAAREAAPNEYERNKLVSKKLPSWVPDFSITPIAETLCMNPRPEKAERRWKASEGLKFTPPPDPINKELRVKGIQVMTIAGKAATYPSFEIDPDSGQIFALLEFLSNLLNQYPAQKAEMIDVFWRTIIKDTYREAKADDEARLAFTSFIAVRVSEIEQWLKRLRKELDVSDTDSEEDEDEDEEQEGQAAENSSDSDNPAPHPGNDIKDDESKPPNPKLTTLKDIESLLKTLSSQDPNTTLPTYTRILTIIADGAHNNEFSGVNEHDRFFSASFRSAYVGRRLFSTVPVLASGEVEGGVRLGIGPESLEEGDQVWVLAGMDVPVVLREVGKAEGRWRLVGECFIEKIMNGEAVRDKGEGDLRDNVLV